MIGAPAGIVVSATLCASGIASRRTRPDSKRVPAGKPPSFTTIATLSDAWTWIERGWLSLRIELNLRYCQENMPHVQESMKSRPKAYPRRLRKHPISNLDQ